jgi:uncharacterized membrane protein
MVRYRKFVKNEDGLALAAIVIIVALLIGIWFMATLAATIIPIAIVLILLIVVSLIVKSFLKPEGGFGLLKSATGFTREAGKSGLGLYDSAKSEYKHRTKKKKE